VLCVVQVITPMRQTSEFGLFEESKHRAMRSLPQFICRVEDTLISQR
jgi:hypothetical protein